MKSKTATAAKIVAVIYLVFTGLYTLSNLFLIPAIRDYMQETWADKQIFGNVISLSVLLVNLIAIILYLVCTSKKPVSIGVLIIPFVLWFLIFTVGEIKDIVDFMDSMSSSLPLPFSSYASRYRSNAITSYFISEAFYVITAVLFRLGLYTLVPKTISDALTGGKKKAAPQQPAYQQPAYAQPQGYQQPAYTQRPAAPQQPAYTQRPAAPQQPAYQQRPAAPQPPA